MIPSGRPIGVVVRKGVQSRFLPPTTARRLEVAPLPHRNTNSLPNLQDHVSIAKGTAVLLFYPFLFTGNRLLVA